MRSSSYPLTTICERAQGRIIGSSDRIVRGVCTLDEPREDHLTFIRAQSCIAVGRFVSKLGGAIAFVQEGVLPAEHQVGTTSLIAVKEPYAAFLDSISLFFEEQTPAAGCAPTAVIDPTAVVDPTASVGPFCFIGPDVKIGPKCVLHSHVTVAEGASIGECSVLHNGVVIRERSFLGSYCTVHDNSVIGADGFGYLPDKVLGLRKVPQVGRVEIGDHVEIGANTCIDRGAVGSTVIGSGTKIDNLVQIGHNARIGAFCIICGQVGIAGSTTIADGVVLGGQVGVADHISICKGVRVGGGTSVTEDISEPGDYIGYPAMKARDWQRRTAEWRRNVRRKNGSRSSGSAAS